MISMTRRKDISIQRTAITLLVSILLTLCVGATIFAILGYDPIVSLYQFFISPVSRPDQLADLFVKACPLIITATGLVFCYRANVWNIGAEGQIVMGAVCAGGVALFAPALADIFLMPLMIFAAVVGGSAWALIPGILKVRFNTNEILVSLMLTYVAALFIDWLVRGPWRDPQSFGFPLTKSYDEAALIQRIDLPEVGTLGQLHWGVPAALLLTLVAYFVMSRTLFGFQVKVMGDAPRAGAFSGFSAARTTLSVFCISGACAGVAGMVEVSANMGQLQPEVSFGYGFTAIIVAFLARLNPLGVIAAGLIIALAELGGDSAQMALGMPKVVTGVFKGILLFMLLAGETYNRYQVRLTRPLFHWLPLARGR
jgi:ABC-type uncharacterized transport system permease subunit